MVRVLKRTRHVSERYVKRRRTVGTQMARRRRLNRSIPRLALRLFETKKKETRWTENSINSLSGWFTNSLMMQLSQDDTYSGIEGHIIRGRGISFKGWFKNNGTSTMIIRFGVMCVKQGSSSIATFNAGSDVLEGDSSNQSITTASSVQRMTQRFNGDQYKAVKQYQIKLGAASATDGSDVRQYRIWVPLNGATFRYDGSGTLPTRNVYSFFAVNCLGNNDEVLGEAVEVSGTATFYYVDP